MWSTYDDASLLTARSRVLFVQFKQGAKQGAMSSLIQKMEIRNLKIVNIYKPVSYLEFRSIF